MILLALATLVAAAPVKLAAPGFRCEGVAPAVCSASLDRFSALLSDADVRVVTANDIAAVLGLERQKQLLGCAEGSCMAELAGALGVDGLITGSVVKAGTGYIVTVRAVKASDGTTMAQATARPRNEDEVGAFLDEAAATMRAALTSRPAPGPRGPSLVTWIPSFVGAAAVATGVVLFILSRVDAGTLRDVGQPLSPTEVTALATRGRTLEGVGVALFAVGAAAIAASVLWSALRPRPPASVWLGPTPGGVVVGGAF